jgi:hypothetical protein
MLAHVLVYVDECVAANRAMAVAPASWTMMRSAEELHAGDSFYGDCDDPLKKERCFVLFINCAAKQQAQQLARSNRL